MGRKSRRESGDLAVIVVAENRPNLYHLNQIGTLEQCNEIDAEGLMTTADAEKLCLSKIPPVRTSMRSTALRPYLQLQRLCVQVIRGFLGAP